MKDGTSTEPADESPLIGAVGPSAVPWESYRPVPPLARGEVHVLRISLPQEPQILSYFESVLSEGEMGRAAAFHFPDDRERHVVARGALRVLLGRHLGASPGSLRLEVNDFGKPVLAGTSAPDVIHFNLSHSGAYVLLALARDLPIGVDVEQVREDVPHLDMASRFFSTTERAALTAQPAARRLTFFFETWTHKEAYMKGRGLGLSIPPQEFSVHVDGLQPRPVDDRAIVPQPGLWWVTGIGIAPDYAAALAVEGTDWIVRCFDANQALRSVAEA